MILVTTPDLPGHRVVRVLGLCRGSSVRAVHLGRDIVASLKNLLGGEIAESTQTLAQAREQALDRMADEAAAMGANAVLAVRFASAEIVANAAELLAYGTAVVVEPIGGTPVRG